VGFRINGRAVITGTSQIVLHENVHIGTNAHIRGEGGVEIGANTHISRNLVLYSTNHNYNGFCLPYDDSVHHKSVMIGRNVWIGMNVGIAPGTMIGDGAIIGMSCTVFGTIPPLAIVGSSPWQVIGYRDAKHYDRLEAEACYGGVGGKPIIKTT
jgi:maltose O-acetyltransferase